VGQCGDVTSDPVTSTTDPATGAPAADLTRRRIAQAVAALALLTLTIWLTLAAGAPNDARWLLLGLTGLSWLAFGLAAWTLMRVPGRAAVGIMLLGAVTLQLVALAFPPRSTDDFYRYVWDGRVQAAGIDPYRYSPVDPALAGLRDPWLFPPECAGENSEEPPCTRMNHPTARTIYPPVAQAAFLAVHVVTRPFGPDGGGARPLQVLAATLAVATALVLVRVLRRIPGGDPRQAVLWAWCPTVVLECGNNAHVDVLAALLLVVALGAANRGRLTRAGLALGGAIAVKLLPVLVLPALLTTRHLRRNVPLLLACLGVIVAGYVPHVLAVGDRALGFLPAYLDEEGYQGGQRFALLRLVVPDVAAAVVGLALIGAVALWALHRDDAPGERPRPWRHAVVLVGIVFALTTVPYPWYALLLVALVALDGRWEWLVVAAAAYPVYFTRALDLPLAGTQQVSYGVAVSLLLALSLLRRRCNARAVPRD
jgi:hypothetical protein